MASPLFLLFAVPLFCSANPPSFPHGSALKNPPTMQEPQEMWVLSLGWEDRSEDKMAIHSYSCLKKFQGQRSLVGYSLWGHK